MTTTVVLLGVNPKTFNLLASILAEILQVAGAYILSQFSVWVLSEHLRRGKQLPMQVLGSIPGCIQDAIFMHF